METIGVSSHPALSPDLVWRPKAAGLAFGSPLPSGNPQPQTLHAAAKDLVLSLLVGAGRWGEGGDCFAATEIAPHSA